MEFDSVCYRTEQREERVALKNLKTGEIGYSLGCEYGGGGIMVDLGDGELVTWVRHECVEVTAH